MAGRIKYDEDADITESLTSNNLVTYEQPAPQPVNYSGLWREQQEAQAYTQPQPVAQKPAALPQWLQNIISPLVKPAGQTFKPQPQPQPNYSGMWREQQEAEGYLNPPKAPAAQRYTGLWREEQEARQWLPEGATLPTETKPTAQRASTKRQYAQFGAEPGTTVDGGWTPERIANASQTELRQFYSLDPRERYWLARAITRDNPRLYGGTKPSSQAAAQQPVNYGYGDYGYNVPYRVQTTSGGGGGGYSYKAKPPEWYLNMISWSI